MPATSDVRGFTGEKMVGARMRLELTGDKALMRKLETLASTTQRAAVRPAANYAWTPVNKAAKRKAPVDTGALKKSIGKKAKTYGGSGVVWVGVGARVGEEYVKTDDRGYKRKPWKYLHIVEWGSADQQAQPFLRPAFDENKDEAERRLIDKTWDYIEKLARS